MIETLIFSNIKFNNNDTIFLGLACVSRNDVVVLDKFDANGVPVFCFKEHTFFQESILFIESNPCACKKIFVYCNFYWQQIPSIL